MRPLVWVCLLALTGCSAPLLRVAAPASSGCPEWAMEGGDPGRTSRSSFPAPARLEAERMTELRPKGDYHPEEHATPLVLGEVAFVGHAGRAFEAVRWRTGEVAWSRPTTGRVFTTAACADGKVIFGDDEGHVVALDLDGREVWRFKLSYPVVSSPLVADGKVFIPVSDQNVFCLEAATGRPVWQYGRKFPHGNPIWRGLGLCWGDGRLYAGFADGSVVALDSALGKVLWRAQVAPEGLFSDVVAGPVFRGGRVYAATLKGPVVCLEAATGAELWRQEQESAFGLALGDEYLYASRPDGRLVGLAEADGRRVFETVVSDSALTVPVVAGRSILVGASEGGLHLLDSRTGALVSEYRPGSGIGGQPLVFRDGVLFLSNGGVLHWLR